MYPSAFSIVPQPEHSTHECLRLTSLLVILCQGVVSPFGGGIGRTDSPTTNLSWIQELSLGPSLRLCPLLASVSSLARSGYAHVESRRRRGKATML